MSYLDKYTDDPKRRSGRTVMAALNYAHIILDNPGTWIEIEDHGPNIQCDRLLFDLVCRVLSALRVEMHIDKPRHKIKCDGPPQPYEYPSADSIMDRVKAASPYSLKRNLF